MTQLPNFSQVLNKNRRFWAYADGNRNPWTSANTYWSLLGGWEKRAMEICQRHAGAKSEKEAAYIWARTSGLVSELRGRSMRRAIIAYRQNPKTRDRHINGAFVLGAMVAYAQQNGHCSAKQGSIANAVGLSRKTVNQWMQVLQEAGLVECVGYDARGSYRWRGREYTRWVGIYAMSFPYQVGRYTIPKGGSIDISAVEVVAPISLQLRTASDVFRHIGPRKIMDTIRCCLIETREDGSVRYLPPLRVLAFRAIVRGRRLSLRFW